MENKSSKEYTSGNIDVFELGSVMKEVDSIIARNMNELSHEDREKSYLDLHGVTTEIQETPSFVEQSLELMNHKIVMVKEKEAYNLAESMDTEYVQNKEFRLKFLRGERFDTCSAAQKFVEHFQVKKELFGSKNLTKDITQDDLGKETIDALYSGFVQWFPIKDISGRTIAINFQGKEVGKYSILTRMRVFFYLRMFATEDVEVQKQGFVSIFWIEAMPENALDIKFKKNSVEGICHVLKAVPGYQHAVHYCFENVSSWILNALFAVQAISPFLKLRFRIHKRPTRQEIMDILRAYGIPTDFAPQSSADNTIHNAILQNRKKIEDERRSNVPANTEKEEQKTVSVFRTQNLTLDNPVGIDPEPVPLKANTIITAGPCDVLFGRGYKLNSHPGNIYYRNIVEEARRAYDTCSRKEKKTETEKIVKAIKKRGRFLRLEGSVWVEVTDENARLKVSHAFRYKGKRMKRDK